MGTQTNKPVVLIIDDELIVHDIISASLQFLGYTILKALDGESGLTLFEKVRPKIVFTDMIMSGLDGDKVTERLKQIDPNVYVITLTGKDVPARGSQALLKKPFTQEELEEVLLKATDYIATLST